MTENGKPKYFTLMEELKRKSFPAGFSQERSCHQRISLQYNIPSAGIRCERALSLLEQEGYIEACHGKGTFVPRKCAI